MQKYLCIIKSGTDYPDFEYEVEASSKEEAIDQIMTATRDEFEREFVERSTIPMDSENEVFKN